MKNLRGILLPTTLAMLLSSCAIQERPTHFYALNAVIDDPPAYRQPGIKVGIGPLDFPKVLQRPQVVTRVDNNKIKVADFHQWGGRLDDDFLRILGDNLVVLLGSTQVYTYPWEGRLRPEYQVRISVSRFDGEPGKEILLRARWQLLSRKGGKELAAEQTSIVEPVQHKNYGAYVAAQSRALARFSRQIAARIMRHAREETGD